MVQGVVEIGISVKKERDEWGREIVEKYDEAVENARAGKGIRGKRKGDRNQKIFTGFFSKGWRKREMKTLRDDFAF